MIPREFRLPNYFLAAFKKGVVADMEYAMSFVLDQVAYPGDLDSLGLNRSGKAPPSTSKPRESSTSTFPGSTPASNSNHPETIPAVVDLKTINVLKSSLLDAYDQELWTPVSRHGTRHPKKDLIHRMADAQWVCILHFRG